MIPDCIDPQAGGLLRGIMTTCASENDSLDDDDIEGPAVILAVDPSAYSGDDEEGIFDLYLSRLHWSSCPACRHEFPDAPETFGQIVSGLKDRLREVLTQYKDDFQERRDSLLATGEHAEIIARLAIAFDAVNQVIGDADFLELMSPEMGEERSWETISSEFMRSLEPDVLYFFWATKFAINLVAPETKITSQDFQRVHTIIVNSGLEANALLQIIESAAHYASSSQTGTINGGAMPPGSSEESWQDAVDSLKAGQMEIIRLIEHNRRRAHEYESYLIAQLESALYSRLHEKTQRALQVAEYLYSINQEPDGFGINALTMVQAYENELKVRVIGPLLSELLAAGEQNYSIKGCKKPLICDGEVPERSMALGNLVLYLKNDSKMREKIKARGFDVETIAKDAEWINSPRNKVAHRFGCDRALADELRQRILCPTDLLSRFHPTVGKTPQ
jgi:hypothetical protein